MVRYAHERYREKYHPITPHPLPCRCNRGIFLNCYP
ncbi:hypothetical protein PANI_CDS0068 [Maribacter phage Panino]